MYTLLKMHKASDIVPSLTVLKYKIPFKPCVLAALEGIYISF